MTWTELLEMASIASIAPIIQSKYDSNDLGNLVLPELLDLVTCTDIEGT